MIYFDGDTLKIRNNVSDYQKKYIYELTFYLETIYNSFNDDNEFNIIEVEDGLEFHIKPEHFNEKMNSYLEIHKNRTDKLYNNDDLEELNN